MERISRHKLYHDQVSLLEKRSTCNRAQVACIILRDNRIVASGYNGSLPNEPHCTDENCNEHGPCKNSVHAEANAIASAAKYGIPLEGTYLICSYNPCPECAKLIIQAGIKHVSYYKLYRNIDCIDLFSKHGVSINLLAHDKV
jgi:dCMP deaminase